MAVAVIPRRTLDIAGPLGSVIAMKQREKEIDKTLALERRRLRLAETRAAAEERRAEAKERREEKAFDPMLAYQAAQKAHLGAQSDYLQAMTSVMLDEETKRLKQARENEALLGDKKRNTLLDAEIDKNTRLLEMMKSSDPSEKAFGTEVYLTGKYANNTRDLVDSLRLKLQLLQAEYGAWMDEAKLKIDQQNSLLTGFKFATEYGPVLEKKIGKDAFKAGYEAMSEMLGFTGAPGGERKAVGSSRALSAPGIGSAGVVAPPPQMTLDQALEAFKRGSVSGEDLINAWPALEGVIDKSLLAPAASPSAMSQPASPGSYEADLMKRLQE